MGRILKSFGPQANSIINEGINIASSPNKNVKSSADGVVIYVGSNIDNLGNLVLIQHENDWVTAYAHLNSFLVETQQKVKQGDSIGKVGSTGDINSPQLHFEIRKNITPVDPLEYLDSYK